MTEQLPGLRQLRLENQNHCKSLFVLFFFFETEAVLILQQSTRGGGGKKEEKPRKESSVYLAELSTMQCERISQ